MRYRDFAGVLMLTLAIVQASISRADVITGPNLEMSKVGELMRSIYPMIIRPSTELTKSQVSSLKQNVASIASHVENTNKQKANQSDTFKLSMQTMLEHLSSAQKALDENNVRYAQGLLRSATTLCSACHTQDGRGRIFTKDTLAATFKNPLDSADYYYMTRNYDEAAAIYQQYIGEQKNIVWSVDSINALERTLVIYLQIRRAPIAAEKYFKSLLAEKKLDKSIEIDVNEWVKGLNVMQQDKLVSYGSDFDTLNRYMSSYILSKDEADLFMILSEEQRVVGLWIKGLLHDYLNAQPSQEQIPVVLFWLATIDRSLQYSLHYSLADLYLKQCIQGYTQHPYAKKCFNLYKEYTYFSFTGSGGTELPDSVEDELYQLEQLLNKKG